MSTIVWADTLLAPVNEVIRELPYARACHLAIDNVSAVMFPDNIEDIVKLPDSRCSRALSRAGILLAAVSVRCRQVLEPFIKRDPFSVGIYSAMENCQNDKSDYLCASSSMNVSLSEQQRIFKQCFSTKHVLKQAASIPASQVGIFLGIMGPQNVFTHSEAAGIHAIEQAECDLQTGRVRVAVVCSAFAMADPLVVMRMRSRAGGRIFREAAVAMVLVNSDNTSRARVLKTDNAEFFYGTADDMVAIALTCCGGSPHTDVRGKYHE